MICLMISEGWNKIWSTWRYSTWKPPTCIHDRDSVEENRGQNSKLRNVAREQMVEEQDLVNLAIQYVETTDLYT